MKIPGLRFCLDSRQSPGYAGGELEARDVWSSTLTRTTAFGVAKGPLILKYTNGGVLRRAAIRFRDLGEINGVRYNDCSALQ